MCILFFSWNIWSTVLLQILNAIQLKQAQPVSSFRLFHLFLTWLNTSIHLSLMLSLMIHLLPPPLPMITVELLAVLLFSNISTVMLKQSFSLYQNSWCNWHIRKQGLYVHLIFLLQAKVYGIASDLYNTLWLASTVTIAWLFAIFHFYSHCFVLPSFDLICNPAKVHQIWTAWSWCAVEDQLRQCSDQPEGQQRHQVPIWRERSE